MALGHYQQIYLLIYSSITNEDPSALDVSPWSLGTTDCGSSHTVTPCFLGDPWGQLSRLSPCVSSRCAAGLKHSPIRAGSG